MTEELLRLSRNSAIQAIFDRAMAQGEPSICAVVCPETAAALSPVIEATEAGVIRPILLGSEKQIWDVACGLGFGLSISEYECRDLSRAAAVQEAVTLAREGKVEAILKGDLHTHDLMSPIVQREGGLRTGGRRMALVTMVDVPSYPKPLLIADVGLNVLPSLAAKKDILFDALEFARAIGVAAPKVAVLSAVETVLEEIPSTGDAARLVEMAKAGEFGDAIVEGPMGFDIAISKEAAKTKKASSLVTGEPDIVIVPNIEAGNILFKALHYLGGGECFSVVIGATVPVVITSRSDSFESKFGSYILTKLLRSIRVNPSNHRV